MARNYINLIFDNFLGLSFYQVHGSLGFISILTEQEMGHFCEPSRCIDSYWNCLYSAESTYLGILLLGEMFL